MIGFLTKVLVCVVAAVWLAREGLRY